MKADKLDEYIVSHSSGSYPILFYKNFTGLKDEILKLENFSSLTIFTERNISQIYLKYLEKELAGIGVPVFIMYLKGGEKNKHIDRLKKVYNQLVETGVDRKGIFLALGGGVVGDFTGFVAATYQRGVRFVQVPTTLLACVDSSVGGKVAVNVDSGKNIVGAFYQPEFVFIPAFCLSTLAEREWRCGFAEIAKHSLLAGNRMWEDFRSHSRRDIESDLLVRMIMDSVKFKADIVSKDEKEQGIRQILNLGHTTGHALESLTGYKVFSHGEAVSIGIMTALILSREFTGFPNEKIHQVSEAFVRYGLPLFHKTKSKDLIKHMKYDKKKQGSDLKFVLLTDIGSPIFGVSVNKEAIQKAWKEQNLLFGR